MKRLLLVANKNWEVEPILNALTSPRFSPDKNIVFPAALRNPWPLPQGEGKPRAVWKGYNDTLIELWCIQDIMEIPDPSDKELYSSSEIKKDNFHKILNFSSAKPDLIIALGTAGFGDETQNNNGCVVIGSNIFIHNFHPGGRNPKSKWDDARFGQLIKSPIEKEFFQMLDTPAISYIESRLLKPFNNPSSVIQLLSDNKYVALSIVNITNYADYSTSDEEGLAAIKKAGIVEPVGSVETTHAVIRLACEARFAFVSGIADRVNHFDEDVDGKDSKGNKKTEAQNYTASFNIGVYLASALSKITTWLRKV